MNRFIRSGAQALEHARRRNGGGKRPPLSAEEIRQIRTDLGLSQKEFTEVYGFDLDTVKSWELGRRVPDQSNLLLLRIISLEPKLMQRLVRRVSKADTDILERA